MLQEIKYGETIQLWRLVVFSNQLSSIKGIDVIINYNKFLHSSVFSIFLDLTKSLPPLSYSKFPILCQFISKHGLFAKKYCLAYFNIAFNDDALPLLYGLLDEINKINIQAGALTISAHDQTNIMKDFCLIQSFVQQSQSMQDSEEYCFVDVSEPSI
jgi:hypothetical protein